MICSANDNIVTTVVVTRNGRCLVCYAENVAPKEALIVKEWNITSKMHCEKKLRTFENI